MKISADTTKGWTWTLPPSWKIRALMEAIQHFGGALSIDKALVEAEDVSLTQDMKEKNARNKYLARAFLKCTNCQRFGGLLVKLENQFSQGNDQYPKDVTEALGLLVSYKAHQTQETQQSGEPPPKTTWSTFAQATAPTPGTDGMLHNCITCFMCNAKGHYSNTCPQ